MIIKLREDWEGSPTIKEDEIGESRRKVMTSKERERDTRDACTLVDVQCSCLCFVGINITSINQQSLSK